MILIGIFIVEGIALGVTLTRLEVNAVLFSSRLNNKIRYMFVFINLFIQALSLLSESKRGIMFLCCLVKATEIFCFCCHVKSRVLSSSCSQYFSLRVSRAGVPRAGTGGPWLWAGTAAAAAGVSQGR